MSALAIAMTLSIVLVAHFLYGIWAAAITGATAFVSFAAIWYVLPIERRRHTGPPRDDPDYQ